MNPPLPDVVFTTAPSVSWASMVGRNALMPLTAPITFTSSDQRQSLTWCSHICPSDAEPTPALLHSTSTAPNASSVASRNDFERRQLGDVGDHTDDVATLVAQLGRRLGDLLGVDVGDDRAHAFVGEAFDQRATDAARAPGDDHDLAGEGLHATFMKAFGFGTPAGGASSYSTNSTR